MDGPTVQDRIARGLGVAARAIGVLCNAYRSTATANPLAAQYRFLQLSAAFNPQDQSFRSAGLPSDAAWYGVFDSAYLLPGDYLLEIASGRVWFVAAEQNLLPALCMLTNRTIVVTRPTTVSLAGVNAYGGGLAGQNVIAGFPVSILHGGSVHGVGALPADARVGGVVVLAPPIANTVFQRGDVITDDLGRAYVVSQAEANQLGWRLDARQAAS